MQRGLNQVTLSGNVGQDPEIREFGEGDKAGKIVTISVATSTVWRKDGENQEKTEWHRVVLFGSAANYAAGYLKKGANVLIVGMLTTRKYQDSEGKDRYTTEVAVNPMENGIFQINGKVTEGGAPAQQSGGQQQAPQQQQQAPQQPQQAPQQQVPPVDDGDGDDDIPF